VLVLRRGGELGWVVGCSLGGESWDGEEKWEIEEERIDRVCVYIAFYRWNHRRTTVVSIPVGTFDGEGATSLYEDPGFTVRRSRFESFGYSVDKIVWKNSTSSHYFLFSKFYIVRRQLGRYIPMELFCRYTPTELPTVCSPSVYITDGKVLSV